MKLYPKCLPIRIRLKLYARKNDPESFVPCLPRIWRFFFNYDENLKPERRCTRQHRSYLRLRLVFRIALNRRFRAGFAYRSRTGGTRFRFRALDNRTAGTRAGRTFTDLTRLRARGNTRRAFRHRTLENVFRHIGLRRAFCLEHIPRHVWKRRTRRHGTLHNPFAHIGLFTRRTYRMAYDFLQILDLVHTFASYDLSQ